MYTNSNRHRMGKNKKMKQEFKKGDIVHCRIYADQPEEGLRSVVTSVDWGFNVNTPTPLYSVDCLDNKGVNMRKAGNLKEALAPKFIVESNYYVSPDGDLNGATVVDVNGVDWAVVKSWHGKDNAWLTVVRTDEYGHTVEKDLEICDILGRTNYAKSL